MTDLRSRIAAALADRYAIEHELGSGGTALVYRARDLKHGRTVAVKVLRPELAASVGPERFLREIRIAAGLTHPHILSVHDSGEAGGLLYFVMPYVEGESLRARLAREGPLPLEDALRIAREVADALAYAHSQGVVHRDIKPGNILLVGGHAVVADFGIAVATGAQSESLTELGFAIGTPAYMSPEQAEGRAPVDGRSDLYSLGCVLFEMLTGRPPYPGPTPGAVLLRHSADPVPSVRAARASVPVQLDRAVTRALAKLPADRFSSAVQLAEALEPAAPAKDGAGPRPVRRALAGAGVAVAALGALLLLARTRPWERASAPVAPRIAIALLPFAERGGGPVPPAPSGAPYHVQLGQALEWLPDVDAIDGRALLPEGGAGDAVASAVFRRIARLGARYAVLGEVERGPAITRLTLTLYEPGTGARVARIADSAMPGDLDRTMSRLAAASVRAFGERDSATFRVYRRLAGATTSAAALGRLVSGQRRFWAGDYDGAAEAFRAAIAADTACALAYHRLGVAEEWRHDFGAALAAVRAGLERRGAMDPRWVPLLEGQRYYLLGQGDSAIARFQDVVLEQRDAVDAWYGLGESLFHYGPYTGHSRDDARATLARAAEVDSTFFPDYDHLVDLALDAGDRAGALRYLARIRADDPKRPSREVAVALRFGDRAGRKAALERARRLDRQGTSQVAALWLRGAFDPATADTLAQALAAASTAPDDRRRAGQLRLVALAAQDRWPAALDAWRRSAERADFDPYIVLAYLSGARADSLAAPMLEWAHRLVAEGRAPDFTHPPWDDGQQAFMALTQRALLRGDSAE
ncbi:MAG TPA: serine/threonine-protein kinase, partial [Gemmatimonadales bacterium]|nr:serine/threonine-protein kinase [Gemmatimonadales bacterium]